VPLSSSADELKDRLDKMREEIIDQDGDLEELYRTARWREPEVASLVVTYHLAWVRYQGAQLTGDAAKKKALLQKAIDGFLAVPHRERGSRDLQREPVWPRARIPRLG